jgi:hypothetical protein
MPNGTAFTHQARHSATSGGAKYRWTAIRVTRFAAQHGGSADQATVMLEALRAVYQAVSSWAVVP